MLPQPAGHAAKSDADARTSVEPGSRQSGQDYATAPIDGDAVFLAPVLAHGNGAAISVSDWDALFNAAKNGLTQAVSQSSHDMAISPELCGDRIRASVLDCVAMLNQLHTSVIDERLRQQRFEMEVFEVQTTLAQLRVALVGAQKGERQARHDAEHDRLTQLPNRHVLRQRITQELAKTDRRQRRFAVLFLDLNGFKRVNDDHGHAAGDELLRIIAARLSRVVRAQDVVSRVGGDEFACLIGELSDRAQLALLAEKIASAIAAPCAVGRVQVAVQVSIGIATCPADGSNADALLQSADRAMYAAKQQQVGHAFCTLNPDADALALPTDRTQRTRRPNRKPAAGVLPMDYRGFSET